LGNEQVITIIYLPALNVASTAKMAVDDAVPAPVSVARPPSPAASAGAASPPVTAKTVPRLVKDTSTGDVFANANGCVNGGQATVNLQTIE
jgi:hypothetical protein